MTPRERAYQRLLNAAKAFASSDVKGLEHEFIELLSAIRDVERLEWEREHARRSFFERLTGRG